MAFEFWISSTNLALSREIAAFGQKSHYTFNNVQCEFQSRWLGAKVIRGNYGFLRVIFG